MLKSKLKIPYVEGYSMPRNKELMRIFRDLDLVEHLGSGMPRILQAYPKSRFRFTDNFIRMSFPTSEKSKGKTSGKTSGKILQAIRDNNQVTIPEMAEQIGITECSIERNIRKLRASGLLLRKEGAKGGHWQILDPEAEA